MTPSFWNSDLITQGLGCFRSVTLPLCTRFHRMHKAWQGCLCAVRISAVLPSPSFASALRNYPFFLRGLGTLPSGFFKLNFNLITLQISVSCCCNRMPEARHFETKDVVLWRLPIPMAWLWVGWWALDCVTWWMTSSWWLHLCEGEITRGRKEVQDGRGQICSFLITLIWELKASLHFEDDDSTTLH